MVELELVTRTERRACNGHLLTPATPHAHTHVHTRTRIG